MRTKFTNLCERSLIFNLFAATVIVGIGVLLSGVVVSLFALAYVAAYLFGWLAHAKKETVGKINDGQHKTKP